MKIKELKKIRNFHEIINNKLNLLLSLELSRQYKHGILLRCYIRVSPENILICISSLLSY
jgi:hypothetical protein